MLYPEQKKLEERLDDLEAQVKAIRSELKKETIPAKIPQQNPHEAIQTTKTNLPDILKKKTGNLSFESFLGTNLLGKLGAFALILTAGWFVKHAIDKHWLNASVRILLGMTTGFSLTGLSLYLAKKHFRLLWPVVAGCGYAIVFISLYAAWYFYGFLGLGESFGLLLFLSILVGLLSIHSRSQVLFIFCLLGIFMIPLIHSQNQNSYRFLFTYLSLVQLGYVLTAYRFRWRISAYVFWVLLAIVYTVWSFDKLAVSNGYIALGFLGINAMLLILRQLWILPKRIHGDFHYGDPVLSILVHFFIFGSGLYVMYVHFVEWKVLWVLYVMLKGLIILILLQYHSKKNAFKESWQVFRLWNSGLLIMISSLAFLGLFMTFEGSWWVACLLGFAGAWLLLSVRMDIISMNILAILLWFITGMFMLFSIQLGPTALAFLNQRFLLFILAAFVFVISWKIWQFPPVVWLRMFWPLASIFFVVSATFYEFADIIDDEQMRNLSYSLILIFYSGALLVPGFLKDLKYLRFAGLALIGVLILKFYFYDIWLMKTGIRILVGLSSGVILIVFSYLYQKFFNQQGVQK